VIDPDPYHTLPGTDRDHLLAAAWYAADHDALPAGSTVGDAVGGLTGDTPTRHTTARSLTRLGDAGLVKRVPGEPTDAAKGVRVTADGFRALARGAARLDAAASVGADAATALADATGRDRDDFAADEKEIPELDELEDADA
jgi:hypothetical protein